MKNKIDTESESIRSFIDDERCRFRKIRSGGLRAVIRFTERCNQNCPHCLIGKVEFCKELRFEEWQKIILDFPELEVKKVLLTGGEPLLHPDILKITEYISTIGISTDLNSNMQLMTQKRMHDFKDAGLQEISVALDAPETIHDKIHGKKYAYRKIIQSIYWASKEGIKVDASCCLTSKNIRYLKHLLDIIEQLPVNSFTISRLFPIGHGYKNAHDTLEEKALRSVYQDFIENHISKFSKPIRLVGLLGLPEISHCNKGSSIIGFKPDGRIIPCVLCTEKYNELPNPLESGLKNAYFSMMQKIETDYNGICYYPKYQPKS